MTVTFKIASHDPRPVDVPAKPIASTPEQVLLAAWKPKDTSCKEMLQSSFHPTPGFNVEDGFVNTVVRAYNNHHNLIIRPDDIWISILSQFNLFVNANAESLRTKFVAHKGKKELVVVAVGTRYTVDFGEMAKQCGDLLKKNIVDPSLHEWILPSFTTTTPNDTTICSIMMMSTLKAYFDYKVSLMCGIPSMTLLGEKGDYETILQKIDRLDEFGEEAATFARLLKPILAQFVLAFDVVAQDGTPDAEFWGRICHVHRGGSGPDYLAGWISAFCSWGKDGKWQGPQLDTITTPFLPQEEERSPFSPPPPFVYEGLRYPIVDTQDVPPGFCEVDVKLDDNGESFECGIVAGHIGSAASGKHELDTLQPVADWFMFIKDDAPIARTM